MEKYPELGLIESGISSKSRETIKRRVKICDILIIITFIFVILTRISTLGYISYISEITKEQIEGIANIVEANPLQAKLFKLGHIKAILLSLLLPSFGLALYVYARNRALKRKLDIEMLAFYVNFVFLVFLLNVINDLSIFIGAII